MPEVCVEDSRAGNIDEMETATETERKYDVPPGFELPPLVGKAGIHSVDGAETHDLDATYFDTDDLRLARNRRTLRRRTGGTDAGWHLKTPGEGSSRTEHRLPLNGKKDLVPDEIAAEVRVIVRERELRPVARLRTLRVETPLRDASGRILALIAQDQVTAETEDGKQRWQEVEVELVAGDAKVLKAVERVLLKAGALPAAGPSKLARALADRLPAGGGGRIKKINPVLRYAEEQREAIAAFDPGVRRGEPEAVHKMRVATRRLRSTLKTFKDSFRPADAEHLNPELRWIAQLLGDVRDGQVLEHKLLGNIEQEGPDFAPVADRIRDHLEAKVAQGREVLARELNGRRYLSLLDAIDRLIDHAGSPDKDPVRRASKALTKADDLLDLATGHGVDAELHEARKAYKRGRYAIEVFVPSVGKPAKTLTKHLTDLQDVLGAHQDSVVARELLRELAADAPDGFPYGILYARQEQVGRDTFGDLPAVVEASRKHKLRAWLS
jgi:CHAD domain-containing protein